jgi:excisionase family DNA binding protein
MQGTELVTAKRAAEILGVHRNTLDRIIAEGRLVPIRIGAGSKPWRRFKVTDLEALLNGSDQ